MASREIKFVKFLGYEANIDSSDNSIDIRFIEDGLDKEKKLQTRYSLKFKFLNNNVEFDIKKSNNTSRFFSVAPMVYTRDTLFLEADLRIKKKVLEFLETSKANEALVVRTGQNVYIGKNVSDFRIYSKRLSEKTKSSKQEQKSVFKAYETPSNMFEIYFSLLQKANIDNTLSEISLRATAKIETSLKNKNLQGSYGKTGINIIVKSILEKKFGRNMDDDIDIKSDSDYRVIEELIEKEAKDEVGLVEKLKNSLFPLKEAGEKIRLPIIDMQAGSGDGIFKGGEEAGIEVNLMGTEIRTLEEMQREDLKDNKNYNVINGVNVMYHLDDYEKLFDNQKYTKATYNTIVYQNPPYTSSNELAKDSLLALKNNTNVFGLYPTSMENFLKENINGFIFNVPKELTGYTDKNVPNNLLFVIGSRFDPEKIKQTFQKGRLSLEGSEIIAKNISVKITDKDVKSAVNSILKILRTNKNLYNFQARSKNALEYAKGKRGEAIMFEPLKRYIKETKEIVDNQQKIKELVETKKDEILSKFNSNEMLKEDKIFPDYRVYDPQRKYQKYSFKDVLLKRSLLVFYRDKYPEIFKIVKELAKDEGIELGLEETKFVNYSLSNPQKPDKKDIVAAESLGLMKLAYYPTSFTLSNREDKRALKEVIKNVYSSKTGKGMPLNIEDEIDSLLDDADRLIIKFEDNISKDDLNVNRNEVLALIDKDGLDIAKLNISLTDFYDTIQELGMFKLDDYVESAKLKDDKKEIILDNFFKQIDDFMNKISNKADITKEDYEKRLILGLKTLLKIKKTANPKKEEKDTEADEISFYFTFAKENGIYDYFKKFVKISNSKDIISGLFKKNALFSKADKKDIEKYLDKVSTYFENKPISFFEEEREVSEELIREAFKELTKNSNLTNYKEEENNFVIDIYEKLSPEYEVRKSLSEASVKSSKMLIVNYLLMKLELNKGMNKAEVYDKHFKNMMFNTFGLMPHQFKNPERFIEISNDKSVDILNWEMRSGKTLTFMTELWMLSLYKNIDADLFLETKNFNDIVTQGMQHLPIIFNNIKFNLPKSGVEKTFLKADKVNEFVKANPIFPNLPAILKDYFIEKGGEQVRELERFGFEFEELVKKVEEKGLTIESVKEKYPDAKFKGLLDKICS